MRLVFSLLVIVLLSIPSALFAETKEIISEGTYNMGDGETPSVAESRALIKAKQIALEQAGTYVESYSKVKNITLTQDEIHVLASGLMEVEILDKKRTVVGDGINFWVKIKAKVNPDKMEEMAKRVKEKSVVEDYKRIQESYGKSQKEIEELKRQLAAAKDKRKKEIIESDILTEEREFQAIEWYNKGRLYWLKKEYDDAIESFTSASLLMSDFAEAYKAYMGRGSAYRDKGQYDRAFKDYDKAIALNPKSPEIYVHRGMAFSYKGEQDKAIADFNKAIDLDPNLAIAYVGRGLAYAETDASGKAIENYNKALAIEPEAGTYYYLRGLAYSMQKRYGKAIVDFNKAITIDPNKIE